MTAVYADCSKLNKNKSKVYKRWDDGFLIRRMTRNQGQQVLKWFGAISPVCHELNVLLEIRGGRVDEDGFYVGELNGELVGSLVKTPIADDLHYIGFLYVVERYRRLGFAHRLFTTATTSNGARNWNDIVCFNTAVAREPVYEKLNYKTFRKLTRYVGVVSAQVDQKLYGTDVRQVTDLTVEQT